MDSQEKKLRQEYALLHEQLEHPDVLGGAITRLWPSVRANWQSSLDFLDDLARIKRQQVETQALVEQDGELSQLAKEELEELKAQRIHTEQAINEALIPKNPTTAKTV